MTWPLTWPFRVSCVLATVLLAGCATQLVPAPGATRIEAGPGVAAVSEGNGVHVVARVDAWRGYPADLELEGTPVLVTVENGGARRVGVRHEHFALLGQDGRTFAVLAPFEIEGSVPERFPAAFAGPGFGYYRVYGPHPRFGTRFGHPFGWGPAWDPFYWEPYATRWVTLPTGDMVQKALPETTLEPGGRVRGFLYFEKVRDIPAVTFRARLVDATTGRPFGTVEIPFVVD